MSPVAPLIFQYSKFDTTNSCCPIEAIELSLTTGSYLAVVGLKIDESTMIVSTDTSYHDISASYEFYFRVTTTNDLTYYYPPSPL